MSLTAYRTLGRSGLRASPLILGAMNVDDGSWGSDPETPHLILDRYPDAGGNFVDTANTYNAGQSEETLGQYFARDPARRGRIVLATLSTPADLGPGRKDPRRAEDVAELDALTEAQLDHPHDITQAMIGFQQGDTTINGLGAKAFQR
ncbi:aldo/keto reductase [Pseudonocardia sp. KRD-184]|uniref:Aldo/keto reductase n=2 Tax=Pseudonocardia oceani TaxID=2792013 RepID=A0ABS6U525_9PSEU|nr:aldo/keto reductase [Pseudonocardia oceani]MBW0096990.1 aldo/keto reductase [Pseudonocardia oceani]MBW0121617.1 aldo/keto reductase [Pseudonocardia oceani]MBW0127093.1 aldo/keto reductase [Pseudonocardia oceani]